jgi:hypothetical protein
MESTTEENWMVRNSSQSETATAFSRLHEHFEQRVRQQGDMEILCACRGHDTTEQERQDRRATLLR